MIYIFVILLGAGAGAAGDTGEDDHALAAAHIEVTGVTGTLPNLMRQLIRASEEETSAGASVPCFCFLSSVKNICHVPKAMSDLCLFSSSVRRTVEVIPEVTRMIAIGGPGT